MDSEVPPTPITDPDAYAEVYQHYKRYLHSLVYQSGVPTGEVDDATASILVRMLAQDGLSKFIYWGHPDQDKRLTTYLASYFRLGARAERGRVLRDYSRTTTLTGFDQPMETDEDEPSDLLERALEATEGDARHFVEIAAQYSTYRQARAHLVDEGWTRSRIHSAVWKARRIVRGVMCTPQSDTEPSGKR